MSAFGITADQLEEIKVSPHCEDLVELLLALARKRREIIRDLRDLKEEEKKRHVNTSISYGAGVMATIGGGLLSLTPLAPIGVGMVAAGASVVMGTAGVGKYLSNNTQDKIRQIVKGGIKEQDACHEILTRFDVCAAKLSEEYGFDKQTAANILLTTIASFVRDTHSKVKNAYETCSQFLDGIGEALGDPGLSRKCKKWCVQHVINPACHSIVEADKSVVNVVLYFAIPAAIMLSIIVARYFWLIDQNVENIDATIADIEKSIVEIKQLIYQLSESFRKCKMGNK